MRPRILTPFADRNIYVEPDFFSSVCKIFPRNTLGTFENSGQIIQVVFPAPKTDLQNNTKPERFHGFTVPAFHIP